MSLKPRFSALCIIFYGIFLKGVTCLGEKENFIIDDSATVVYVISNKKRLRRNSDSYLFIYSLPHFVESENIYELYINFFKQQPYMMNESIQNIFKIHRKRFNK